MELQFEKWYSAIHTRRSRRTFISKQIEPDTIQIIKSVIEEINTIYKGARLLLVEKAPDDLLVGAVGPYGRITGALNYVAVIIDYNGDHAYERGGYIGQAIVLEASNYVLSSCWIGGYFKKEVAAQKLAVPENETVIAIIPIGYARKNYSLTEKMMNQVSDYHKRKPIKKIVAGLPIEQWPNWIEASIQAASLAPSAYNRQPFRYTIGADHSLTIDIENPIQETKVRKELDLGIVMLHIELAAKHHQIIGDWEFVEAKKQLIFKEVSS